MQLLSRCVHTRTLFSHALVLGCFLASVGCVRLAGEPERLVCNSDLDCPGDEICSARNACVDKEHCDYNRDCGEKSICVDERCQAVGCARDSECAPYACDLSIHECMTSCNSYDNCSSSEYTCKAGACVDVECSDTQACDDGFACKYGVCRTSCMTEDDCRSDYDCENGECTRLAYRGEPCEGDESCESGLCCFNGSEFTCSSESECDWYVCEGRPNPCARRDLDECESGGDCQVEDSAGCIGGNYRTNCAARAGACGGTCVADPNFPYCSNSPDCITYERSTCDATSTCQWVEQTCQGTSRYSCAGLSLETCHAVPGCSLKAFP